jgi:Leucine-rich repeat (LRR) protein
VDLSNCELSQLPQELFELTNLVELSLAGNQLTQLPPDIGRLSSLQRLVLAGNWLEHLPQVMPGAGSSTSLVVTQPGSSYLRSSGHVPGHMSHV